MWISCWHKQEPEGQPNDKQKWIELRDGGMTDSRQPDRALRVTPKISALLSAMERLRFSDRFNRPRARRTSGNPPTSVFSVSGSNRGATGSF
jgi:hypothetical protein